MIAIIGFLKRIFSKEKYLRYDDIPDSELCIVGNIVDKHYYGEHKEIRRGTKHFRPNAKVYCLPEYGGTGHETMVVLGLPRRSNKLIKIAIPSKRIKNFKLKAVYKPEAMQHIKESWFYKHWKRHKPELKNVEGFIKYLNSLTEEII